MKLDVGSDVARNFITGEALVMVAGPSRRYSLRPANRRERAGFWLRDRWLSATRWLRPRTVASAVDVEAGCITLATERWSWLRWRWVRS